MKEHEGEAFPIFKGNLATIKQHHSNVVAQEFRVDNRAFTAQKKVDSNKYIDFKIGRFQK